MARKAKPDFDEKKLSKGNLRKLTALRKSLGDDIANSAFASWMTNQSTGGSTADKNADKIADLLTQPVVDGEIKIPRGGYLLRRGRGRVIVETPSE